MLAVYPRNCTKVMKRQLEVTKIKEQIKELRARGGIYIQRAAQIEARFAHLLEQQG